MSDAPIVIEFTQTQRFRFEVDRDTWGQIVHGVDPDLDPDENFLVMVTMLNLLPGSESSIALHRGLEDAHAAQGHPDPIGVHTQLQRVENPHRKVPVIHADPH